MRILTIIICFCLLSSTFAAEVSAGKMTYLEITQPAPYNGYLSDEKQMKHFRQINEEYKLLQEKSDKQEFLLKINDTELNYYKDNYLKTREELDKEQKATMWKMGAAFAGGILLTLTIGGVIIWLLPIK